MEGTTYPRMNKVFLTGIAQEEPELRYTPSGVTVCSFRVQVGRVLRDRAGGSREVAAYLTIVAWQETAQRMARELRRGQIVYVEGYVSSRSFTTARGDKRTAVEIYAEQIQTLGPSMEGDKGTEGPRADEGRGPAGRGRRGPADERRETVQAGLDPAPGTEGSTASAEEPPEGEHHAEEHHAPEHPEGERQEDLASGHQEETGENTLQL
ncbi:MAG: single-stranded DNA-binding protein [Candidatus Eisenbacteria bacterium]|nr:single-stranded DNA-binding protein [Candidatus Eisenbacteria bacterium]